MFNSLALKVGAVVGVALVTTLGVFITLWYLGTKDLEIANSKVTALSGQVDGLTKEVAELKLDQGIKSALNLELKNQVDSLQNRQDKSLQALADKMAQLEKKYPKSTVVIDNTKYLEAAYVEESGHIAVDAMWDGYCQLVKSKVCEVPLQ